MKIVSIYHDVHKKVVPENRDVRVERAIKATMEWIRFYGFNFLDRINRIFRIMIIRMLFANNLQPPCTLYRLPYAHLYHVNPVNPVRYL